MPVPADLIGRLDTPGPRYTSYPTADRFVEAFGPADHQRALQDRTRGPARSAGLAPLSIYVHVPFCDSVCYYCACNKVVTRNHERARPYLVALEAEIALHASALGGRPAVAQLHLGGGTPTFLSDEELACLIRMLDRAFTFVPGAERAIEVDPRTVDASRLAHLSDLGFNRISFGVQDVNLQVQQAVHRVQSITVVEELLVAARRLGFTSTNVDLIYGLPQQTPETFRNTVKQICALRPDRIALYAYAHLPQRFKPQRRIEASQLPEPAAKISMLAEAIEGFSQAGYAYIGMDHFALPDDPMAVARRQGRLHRNFQGYSTRPDCDLIGLGVSAISRIGATYSQNAKSLADYVDAVTHGQFATVRGLALSRDDVLRRAVIMGLMCQGRVDIDAISMAHLVDFRLVFARELQALANLQSSGLVEIGPDAIDVTLLGWYFVRSIAMVFDRHLQTDRTRAEYSRIV